MILHFNAISEIFSHKWSPRRVFCSATPVLRRGVRECLACSRGIPWPKLQPAVPLIPICCGTGDFVKEHDTVPAPPRQIISYCSAGLFLTRCLVIDANYLLMNAIGFYFRELLEIVFDFIVFLFYAEDLSEFICFFISTVKKVIVGWQSDWWFSW